MKHELIPLPSESFDVQEALFEVPEGIDVEEVGFRGPVVCGAVGITYRQLDYWARTGLVPPSVRGAHGAGSSRLYSFADILALQVVRRLLDTGVSLPNIRSAVKHLRGISPHKLGDVTLISDGVTVYACTSADDITDIVRGGQGVFGIAIGQVWNEIQSDLAQLRSEAAVAGGQPQDELFARRERRRSAS